MWYGIFFVMLAMAFGYIFPILQKWSTGIPITDAETLGFFIVVGMIVVICIVVRHLEKTEKKENYTRLVGAFTKALKEAGLANKRQ